MNQNSQIRRELFPSQEPRAQRRLRVSSRHELYVEECGIPSGLPAIALHGGPGGGISPEMRRFFDPQRYRVLLFDQRGCGRSTPHAELAENTTWDLVADIERIREQAGIDKWVVFGGSWGSTLALAYAAAHPERVLGLVLRGIFLLTESEVHWFYQEGASRLFPDAFDQYQQAIPLDERKDMVSAFYQRLTSTDPSVRVAAARAWTRWEGDTISFEGPKARPTRFNEDHFAEAFARIECHYFAHKGFFESDGWLLKAAPRYADIPGVIVHGRYDVVTPLSSAYELKKAWPKAELKIIPDAGHSSLEPGVTDALIRATDKMADLFYRP